MARQRKMKDPVDFEPPDTSNMPRPYKFIKRNIYLTKKPKRVDDGIFCSCNSPGSLVVCGDSNCHCGMLLSSCSSGCKCGSACLNKPFEHRPVKKMKLEQTEKCGLGIVADEDIKEGEFIIEYVGEVIDDETCVERLWTLKHLEETNFYLCEINHDMVIDATYKGNESRYINHSCCPNTEMQKWRIDGETRIGIFATRDISRGEHLTYDYQLVQYGADQDCHCGAAGCRKTLGVKASNPTVASSEAALKFVVDELLKIGGLPLGSSEHSTYNQTHCIDQLLVINPDTDDRDIGVIKWYDQKTNRHMLMFEDGRSRLYDLSKEKWDLVEDEFHRI